MDVKEFYDQDTSTFTYIVHDEKTLDAIIIDPVLNFNASNNKVNESQVADLCTFINTNKLTVHFILETHVHADHLSASQVLKNKFPETKLAINKNIRQVQQEFAQKLGLEQKLKTDGHQFDQLLNDSEIINAGSLKVKVLFTPGHTPACTSFLINDSVFTGDALFLPDLGCGRCDFPGGSAEDLYNSVKNKIYTLPDSYKVYVGHDYPPQSRELSWMTTISAQKQHNKALNQLTELEDFVKFRSKRDSTLNDPKLLIPSMKVNLNGGQTNLL